MYPLHGLSLLCWIAVGIIAGWLTGKLMRGASYGILMDLILGLVGAVIGGWISAGLGIFSNGFLGSLAAATIGAIMLVATARLFDTGHISMP
jgi:uncharacterized membrane protein YeaQ/YmgE (transglycosylase-associated protein family)